MRDNMADLFDAMRFYDERGPREPDPALSAEVARRAHARRAGARMVGDSLTSDVRGDLAVGMTTVGISRGHPLPEGGPQPHDVVADTFSLLATVQADSTAHTPRSST